MTSSRIVYRPRPDATPEAELVTLVNVYSFVLRYAEAKEAAASPSSQSQTWKEVPDALLNPDDELSKQHREENHR